MWSRQRNLRFRIVCNLPKISGQSETPVRVSSSNLSYTKASETDGRSQNQKSGQEYREIHRPLGDGICRRARGRRAGG